MRLKNVLSSLKRDRRGNVLIIFGFAIIPMTFATAMGIDYSHAARLETKLNALADAAALSTVTKTMMNQSDATALATAKRMFDAQAATVDGLQYNNDVEITITHPYGSQSRATTVSYAAKSLNSFGGILGAPTIAISGTSVANNQIAPDIDFYLVLDNSPSMTIAATQAGINTMIRNTPKQDGGNGCAFGCHFVSTSSTSGDAIGNPTDPKTGKTMDNYALARSLGITLRSDLVYKAAEDLMDTAATAEKQNNANYRMSISTFDDGFNNLLSMTSDLTRAKQAASNITMPAMWSNSYKLSSDGRSGVYNNDTNTNFTAMGNGLTSILAPPGNGTRVGNDRPQAVIFIVTDGVRDEAVNGNVGNRWIGQLERPQSAYPYSRAPYAMDPQVCEQAKQYGYRIAILYTEYLPLPSNGFYQGNVAPFQSEIGQNLQSCASPGLYSIVSTDGDISAALSKLFAAAVATARLTQ